MLVFHEGLPGAGKSYEACVHHILPAIKEGRTVVTNIEGINHEKFAQLSGIPLKFIEQCLHCVDHVDIPDIEERNTAQKESIIALAKEDSLVVIDEIQDLWPSNRQKMHPDHQKFFTEHRHKGHDIICMGQDRRDCHNVIRRRIQRCIVFTKKTALGQPNKYKWEAFEATTPEKYNKISSGGRDYEKKYFGLYASHTGATKNKSTYSDTRTNIFKQKSFVYGIALSLGAAFLAVKFLIGFFTEPSQIAGSTARGATTTTYTTKAPAPAPTLSANSKAAGINRAASQQATSPNYKTAQLSTPQEKPPEPPPMDIFHEDIKRYRPRLSGYVSVKTGLKAAYVEIVDTSLHVRDRYSLAAIEALGWTYRYDAAGLHVSKEKFTQTVRPWPIDPFGRASDHKINAI